MREPAATVAATVWRQSGVTDGNRTIPEETAVAFTYDGGSYAVMMSTPRDLEDFALGFSFTEGVISSAADIKQLEIVEHDSGTELRMWLTDPCAAALGKRRRYLAGPTGCGLCGIDSLTEAVRPIAHVGGDKVFTPAEIMRALSALPPRQELNRQTRAVHAAAFWRPEAGLIAVREDVGRHNALDKLAGALLRSETSQRRRHDFADQPRVGGNGTKNRCYWLTTHCCGVRADRACPAHRRSGRHHARRRCAR